MSFGARLPVLFGSRWPRGYLNLGSGYLPTWSAKLAQVKAGTGRARILCLGDSTTRGTGAGTGANLNIGAEAFAYPKKLADYITSRGVSANQNSTNAGTFGTGGTDSRVTLNGWAAGATSLGGATYSYATDTASLSFVPTLAFDNIRIGYVRLNNNGIFTYNVDGGAALATVDSDGATSVQTTTASCALGTHTINIQRTGTGANPSGPVRIIWIEVWDSTVPSVQTFNAGWSGASASDLATNGNAAQAIGGLTTFGPDLTIINIGVNDLTAATAEATFKTNVQTVITTARLSGDVILVSLTPATQSEGSRLVYARYLRDLAVVNRCPFVDITSLMGTDANASANNWKGNALHINAAGYAVEAPLIGRALAGL